MTDEEKKIVDYWKNYMEISHWDTQLVSEHHMKVLLDLIEKQSKEIEELKEMNKKLEEKLKIAKQLYNNSCICIATDCVEKDKIKAKIEELEKQDRENKISHNYLVIPILQSLLKEEE